MISRTIHLRMRETTARVASSLEKRSPSSRHRLLLSRRSSSSQQPASPRHRPSAHHHHDRGSFPLLALRLRLVSDPTEWRLPLLEPVRLPVRLALLRRDSHVEAETKLLTGTLGCRVDGLDVEEDDVAQADASRRQTLFNSNAFVKSRGRRFSRTRVRRRMTV